MKPEERKLYITFFLIAILNCLRILQLAVPSLSAVIWISAIVLWVIIVFIIRKIFWGVLTLLPVLMITSDFLKIPPDIQMIIALSFIIILWFTGMREIDNYHKRKSNDK